MKSISIWCAQTDSFTEALLGCSWELGGKDILSEERASDKERLPIVSCLGLYQASYFQLAGPNLMSFPLEPCQGVWFGFQLALGALGAEMDECSNDSCLGPHSHQHICGEVEGGWVSQSGGPFRQHGLASAHIRAYGILMCSLCTKLHVISGPWVQSQIGKKKSPTCLCQPCTFFQGWDTNNQT